MASMAYRAGVPRDALERFLSLGYVPQPKQLQFHAAARACDEPGGATEVGFGGVRGESKSHAAIAQIALDDCQRFHGIKFLWLRKVGKAVRESFEDIRLKILGQVEHNYNRADGLIEFKKTGSKIILGHFKDEKDIDSYIGLEYDGLLIEEANQLTEKKHRDIKTCRRTSKSYWRPRSYYTFNPGGVGHGFLKRKFIDAWRKDAETDTRFVFAARGDNAFVDPDYRKSLDELVGWQRAAWRDGDWDIAAGQYFTNWRHDVHVKSHVVVIDGQPVWCALDYGFTHPTVCYLFTEHDGKKQVVDEYWKQKALVSQNAEGIKQMLGRHKVPLSRLRSFVAGADVFANRGDEKGKTIADQYKEHGIILTPANTDRINGAGQILSLLGDVDEGIESRLEISERCTRLIECLPAMQHDPHRPEDVLKVDVDEDGNGGDDPYDTARYGLMDSTQIHEEDPDAHSYSYRTY